MMQLIKTLLAAGVLGPARSGELVVGGGFTVLTGLQIREHFCVGFAGAGVLQAAPVEKGKGSA
jgi:hypothetical protein